MTAVSIAFIVLAAGQYADNHLSELEAVQLGLQHPSYVAMQGARLREADGSVAAAGRWSNPEVEISQEKATAATGDATDRFLWIRQSINIAGVPGLEKRAGESGRKAVGARQELDARERAREVRIAFYRVLAETQRQELFAFWSSTTLELSGAIAARVEQGDASRFDLLRMQREAGSARASLAQSESSTVRARGELFALLDSEPRPLNGALLPTADAPSFFPKAHPLAIALSYDAEEAQWVGEAANRSRWPQVTVGIGHKDSQSPGFDGDGPLLGVEMEIPLFQRGSAERQIAMARMDSKQWERAATLARLSAQYDAAVDALEIQRSAAKDLIASTDESILNMARAAYEQGEIAVTELVDAYQSYLQARLLAVEIALDARRTWIDLTYLTGEKT